MAGLFITLEGPDGSGKTTIANLAKERLEKEVLRGEKMLSNPGFINKAPESKVKEEKEKLSKYKEMLENTIERLNGMK